MPSLGLISPGKKEKFMSPVMRKLFDLVVHSSTENRLRALHVFYNLIHVSCTVVVVLWGFGQGIRQGSYSNPEEKFLRT
jgi:hypothetical protein